LLTQQQGLSQAFGHLTALVLTTSNVKCTVKQRECVCMLHNRIDQG